VLLSFCFRPVRKPLKFCDKKNVNETFKLTNWFALQGHSRSGHTHTFWRQSKASVYTTLYRPCPLIVRDNTSPPQNKLRLTPLPWSSCTTKANLMDWLIDWSDVDELRRSAIIAAPQHNVTLHKAQYTPPTRHNYRVASRRRRQCKHNSQLAHDNCRRFRSTVWKLTKQTPYSGLTTWILIDIDNLFDNDFNC